MPNTNKSIDMPVLSDRDMELLICALRSAEGGFPKVDAKKLAEMAGFKNANSASVSFGQVRKKVMGEAGSAKPTPNKRKQSAAAGAGPDNSDESPTKKVKTASKKTAKKEQQASEEPDEDESAAFI